MMSGEEPTRRWTLSLAGALAGAVLPPRRGVADGVEMPIARPRRAEAE